jgi:DNA-binding NarL/FixJ family response regulator
MKNTRPELRLFIAAGHPVVRRGIYSFLENRPEWKICGEASTAADAIEKVRALRPDILLLDLTLPDIQAVRAISQILEISPPVKIVALVEHGSPELAATALVAGAHGVVLKSEGADEVVFTVKSVAQGRSFLSTGAVAIIQNQLATPTVSKPQPTDLTPRELQVLESLARGLGNKQLAAALGISVKTVNAHRANIMRKLKLRSYSELVQFAVREHIIHL